MVKFEPVCDLIVSDDDGGSSPETAAALGLSKEITYGCTHNHNEHACDKMALLYCTDACRLWVWLK